MITINTFYSANQEIVMQLSKYFKNNDSPSKLQSMKSHKRKQILPNADQSLLDSQYKRRGASVEIDTNKIMNLSRYANLNGTVILLNYFLGAELFAKSQRT